MDTYKEQLWKDFRLNTELHVAGGFIHDALYAIDLLEHFSYPEECFDILYKTSVGIERLAKIAIILIEYKNIDNRIEFEDKLRTHNNSDLIKRIEKHCKLNLGEVHYRFLHLLSSFYMTNRYDRYSIDSCYRKNQDQYGLIDFIEKSYKVNIEIDNIIVSPADQRIKDFLGKVISKISLKLYDVIRSQGMFTHEIRYNSKAFKVFMCKDINFEAERLLQRELLLFLVKSKTPFHDFINNIDPLDFDTYEVNEYLKCIFDVNRSSSARDELETFYEDQDQFDKERCEFLKLMGQDGVRYDTSDHTEEEYS